MYGLPRASAYSVLQLLLLQVAKEKGLLANEWVEAALVPADGRGGGKADNAVGTAKSSERFDECVEAAAAFAAGKL